MRLLQGSDISTGSLTAAASTYAHGIEIFPLAAGRQHPRTSESRRTAA